ncbi:MAG: hypothetical protein KJ771_08955 [Nanoarchaeota archaeon]|nr:hypothetical protein [Nanoarchaeota archaeon]
MIHKKHKKTLKLKIKVENLSFFIGLGIFLLITFIIIAPTKTHHYEVEVPYTDTETYSEKEPYETQEEYQTQEPYQTTETYYDQVPVQKKQVNDASSGQYYPSCNNNCYCSKQEWNWNMFEYICVQCTCQITEYQTIAKERPVTKYTTVTKYRTVTKYKDVQKTREVIKTKMDPRQVEVNWIFNFKLPYKLHLPYISDEK